MKSALNSGLIAIAWLFVLLITALLAFSQPTAFDSSIMALLPKSEQKPLVQQAVDQVSASFSKRLTILVSGEDETSVRSATAILSQSLAMVPEVSTVRWQVLADELKQSQQALFPYRFSVLDEHVRETLLAGDFNNLQQRALWKLYSPLAMSKGSIKEDPFGLFSELTLNQKTNLNIQVSNNMLKVSGTEKPTYLLLATLSVEPFSPDLQQRLLNIIDRQEKQLAAKGISLQKSGMLLHAAAGARQAKSEMSTIGVGSLVGIVLIMLLVFRQLKPLLLMLLPVAVGCVFATAITVLFFDRVHLITFAFGAGLVGVSIDYALHYLCKRRVSLSAQALSNLLPGLVLGLLSSVLAYAALALTPFPGLRQMAVFSVAGLIGSWLTVVLWLPVLMRRDKTQPLAFSEWLACAQQRFPTLHGNPVLMGVIAILLLISVFSLWNSENDHDIRLLQTSPASLLAQEQTVQKTLGVSSSSQFLLVSCESLEQCLQREEQLLPELKALSPDESVIDYQALSSVLPSLQRQTENSDLIKQLYEQQLPVFFEKLTLPTQVLTQTKRNFETLQTQRLTPAYWQQQLGSADWKALIVQGENGRVATVIRFGGFVDDTVRQQLKLLAAKYLDISYVDQVQNVSDLMASYRNQVVFWVLLAYLLVAAILLTRYKRQAWRILLPPLLASIFTLAILVQLQGSVNLFHLMALILVLGIGLDMGIFMNESGGSAHTWLAVSLSVLTSLLAFGLLALSKTPVLHHFGLTVLMALIFSWLLAISMRKNHLREGNL